MDFPYNFFSSVTLFKSHPSERLLAGNQIWRLTFIFNDGRDFFLSLGRWFSVDLMMKDSIATVVSSDVYICCRER